MTMMEIVHQLQREGHTIDFYVRKDGGILVKNIDGEKYPTGASGNARARQLAKAPISEARISQLKYATRVRKRKRLTLDEQIEKEYNRVKKMWNKAFKAKGGKPHPAGYFGKSRIEYSVKHYGKKEALRRIKEAEKYATGFAYSKNVEYLEVLIRDAGNKYQSQALLDLADDVAKYGYTIKEDWIYPAYQELYKLNQGEKPKDVAKNTRAILRL